MSLTVVMYHYVRDAGRTQYPAIKGRDLASFGRQLDFIAEHHTVVTAEQVIAAAKGDESLPPDAAWLTFDDGYREHYSTVFPMLEERSWQGSFFPPARTARDGELLDVNKTHFVVAACPDLAGVIDIIRDFVEARQDQGLRTFSDYWTELAMASRLDTAEVIFIKRMLQHALPEAMRTELADALFRRFVSADPAAFAAELYLNTDDLRAMVEAGMYVGSHGAGHFWLNRLEPDAQAAEIDASLEFLESIGAPTYDWVMCYPYGGYNETLLPLLRDRGCAVGLTTRVAVAEIGADAPLELPRLDTNDLPH